jgi:hypothetical protein
MKGAACGSLGFVAGLNKLGAAAADKDYKLGTSDPAKIWSRGWAGTRRFSSQPEAPADETAGAPRREPGRRAAEAQCFPGGSGWGESFCRAVRLKTRASVNSIVAGNQVTSSSILT